MFKINEWDCIELNEYKGNYEITLGYAKKDGSFGVKFCKREFGKGNEKNVPVKIPLGDKEKAISVLRSLLEELESTDDDVPF
jgi:hypothetical protein